MCHQPGPGVSHAASAAHGWRALMLVSVAATGAAATGPDFLAPRLYQVTTETVMPHLEENLRYAITHEERCLGREDLATEFPILAHPALKGCALGQETRQEDVISYTLVCEGTHGTTGSASWELGQRRVTGTLNIKLGGKNMTFYQRIIAVPAGACVAESGAAHL